MSKQNKRKKQNNKNKINKSLILGIIITIIVMLTLLGLTYAYYRTRVVGNKEEEKSINNPSKILKVIYEDDNPEVVTDPLYAPGRTVSKDFQVRNVGDDTGNYSIILDNIENTLERTWDIRYILKDKAGKELVKGTLGKELKKQMVYADISIEVGELDEYTLELEYEETNEDQSEDMGKRISFKIDIIEAHENIFKDIANENTLLYAIGRDNEITKTKTFPGRAISSVTEAVLSYTEDDYGTSYYFRGKVQNNYVTFAGMCWRIVRVLGNGDIKLILYDEEYECGKVPENLDRQDAAFAKSIGHFGDSSSHHQTTFEKLLSWYNEKIEPNINDIENKIKTADWCEDLSFASIGSDGTLYYGTYKRIEQDSKNSANPSLKCNFLSTVEGYDAKSVKLQYQIGILTADEIAFAGHKYYQLNKNCYIYENAESNWNTLSYTYAYGQRGPWRDYRVDGVGLNQTPFYGGYTRPSIVLNSNVAINEDSNGTKENPYVII